MVPGPAPETPEVAGVTVSGPQAETTAPQTVENQSFAPVSAPASVPAVVPAMVPATAPVSQAATAQQNESTEVAGVTTPFVSFLPSTGQPALDLALLALIPGGLAGAGLGIIHLAGRRRRF
jgi:hypothetical protein